MIENKKTLAYQSRQIEKALRNLGSVMKKELLNDIEKIKSFTLRVLRIKNNNEDR